MISQTTVTTFKDVLAMSDSIIVVLPAQPNYEKIATALALKAAFENMDKTVELACPDDIQEQVASLPGSKNIKQKIGSRNLSISFEYDENRVDSVSYHISEDKSTFFLVVKPKPGYEPLASDAVEYDYIGSDADLVVMVGVHDYAQLEHLYDGFENVYESATVASIHTFETEIGGIKIDTSTFASLSEGTFELLDSADVELNPDAATNFLAALDSASQSFSALTTQAHTFEVAASLLKRGARRLYRGQNVGSSKNLAAAIGQQTQSVSESKKTAKKQKMKPVEPEEHTPSLSRK